MSEHWSVFCYYNKVPEANVPMKKTKKIALLTVLEAKNSKTELGSMVLWDPFQSNALWFYESGEETQVAWTVSGKQAAVETG